MRIVDSYYNDGVSVTLSEDNGSYSIVRKDGKYSYVNNLGKVSRDRAQYEFANTCR